MSSYALTAFVFALVPVCILRPWLGILAWYWIGLMNPHRLSWGWSHDMPFAMIIGTATLLGALFAKDRRSIPWSRELVLIAVLLLYFTFTTFFAWAPVDAWPELEKVAKIIAMTFLATMFIYGRTRIHALLLVVALSVGFYGFKGGIWSILRGGAEQVLGPEQSFMDGNTFIGLALNMVIPLLVALGRVEARRWLKHLLYLTAALSVVASIFTYSRGAWLGLAVVLPLVILQFKRSTSFALIALLVPALVFLPVLLPDKVFNRAETIEEYEADGSANQRLMSWTVHWRIGTQHPLTGAGFELEAADDSRWLELGDAKYQSFLNNSSYAAHSIYFQILGQHGLVCFLIFLALLVSVHLTLNRLRRRARETIDADWIGTYATGIQIALVAYMVSGAFLSSAYFDLAWLYYALAAILSRELATQEAAPERVSGRAVAAGMAGGAESTAGSTY